MSVVASTAKLLVTHCVDIIAKGGHLVAADCGCFRPA
jgi:hypothetical protein